VTVLTTLCLLIATVADIALRGWSEREVPFTPILFITFGVGALNTTFVKDGEVSVPLSDVTGTLVKRGQGIERHISGGNFSDWLGYLMLYVGFGGGAAGHGRFRGDGCVFTLLCGPPRGVRLTRDVVPVAPTIRSAT
jgi:uncharacterized membrane protein YoaK (UPF0700 family)